MGNIFIVFICVNLIRKNEWEYLHILEFGFKLIDEATSVVFYAQIDYNVM